MPGTIDDLRSLAKECAVFLIEMEIVDGTAHLVDDDTFNRLRQPLAPPDDISFLRTAHKIYVQHRKFPEALALAIRLGDPALIREDFNAPGNPANSIPPGARANTYRVATHPVRES
ncbi:hypothetical protein R3P38DRAFT_3215967 [Favolaschia claudopus]|uniref:RPN1 N-terminal domain-containing protein n=1 Tax=Favolaschia claudopus TaxID=2862362 RepID=A0AAW0A7K5_9AGAR